LASQALGLQRRAIEHRQQFGQQFAAHARDQRRAHALAAAEVMQQRRVAHVHVARHVGNLQALDALGQQPRPRCLQDLLPRLRRRPPHPPLPLSHSRSPNPHFSC
jgi:hypothetical protein